MLSHLLPLLLLLACPLGMAALARMEGSEGGGSGWGLLGAGRGDHQDLPLGRANHGRSRTQVTKPVTDRRSDMTLLIFLALLIALDLAAWWWGHDSRDSQDWHS